MLSYFSLTLVGGQLVNSCNIFFREHLLANNTIHTLINKAFDANDMAMCMDAVRRGVPILTVNDKIKGQVVA